LLGTVDKSETSPDLPDLLGHLAERQGMLDALPQGRVTFRGRGLAFVYGARLVLKVCPDCSQWNAPAAADKGHCGWCAYVPSHEDVEPAAAPTSSIPLKRSSKAL
jgi:hypothetical protein